jgi:hypothetical protein
VDLLGLEGEALAEQARRRDIPRILACDGDGWRLVDGGGERAMTEAGVWQEAASWLKIRPWSETRPWAEAGTQEVRR